MKDKEIHGLLKIPAEQVISQLRIELGKDKSRIQELEDAMREIKSQIDLKEIKETKLIHLETLVENFRKKNEELTAKLAAANKQNALLQQQLIENLKTK